MERKTFKSKTKTTLLKEVSLMSIWSLKLSIKKNMDYSSIPIIFFDHIHSNFAAVRTSGGIVVEIADHLSAFTVTYNPTISPFPDCTECWNFKKFHSKAFRNDLGNTNWSIFWIVLIAMRVCLVFFVYLIKLVTNMLLSRFLNKKHQSKTLSN